MKKSRYKNLFIYSTPQFSGNMEEYFVNNTEKLLVIVIMPDSKDGFSFVRLYKKGLLVEEKKVKSFENKLLYYTSWYVYQIYFMMRYFSRNEKFVIIGGHPLCFFGMWIQRILRKVTFVYMIGDYFPTVNAIYYLFQKLKEFYHRSIPYSFYLSDPVNKIMNGRVVNTENRKTIMWGVNPRNIQRNLKSTQFNILFVGLIKDSQGLELLFEFLRIHKNYSLKIIGITHGNLYEYYQKKIESLGISKQVYYPNRFFSKEELDGVSKTCFVGVALYLTGKNYGTYFVDPGKVKAYLEMQLPVIMTNTSAIVTYIKKYDAGEVIESNVSSFSRAISKVKRFYGNYLEGVKKFNDHFYYETYYKDKFSFLESI